QRRLRRCPRASCTIISGSKFRVGELRSPTLRFRTLMAKRPAKPIAVDELTEKQAKAEYARLQAEIAAHDRRYYQDDAPTVSDAEYDALRQRYNVIETRFPDLRTLESLSLKVGAAPARGFAKLRHRV